MGFLNLILITAKYTVLLLVPYILVLGSYRVLLHPLRSYPGPPLARLSNAYGGFYAWNRCLYLKTWRDHLKYGPVIRQGPDKLVFNSLTAVHDIYLNENVSKSTCYQAGNVNPKTTNVLTTIDKKVHRIKRKLVGTVVSERSMKTFEPTMLEQISIFIKQLLLLSRENSPINMSDRCKYLGLDIAGYLGFGYSLNLQTDEENRFLFPLMKFGSWRLNLYMQFPAIRKFRYDLYLYIRVLIRGKGYLNTLTKMIKARLSQDPHAHHDLYSVMMDSLNSDDPEKVALNEIWTEAISFMPAAGDTTSTTLSSLFFYLAQNPDCKRKLVEEIQSTFTSGEDIRAGAKLSGCIYLRACIDEALRMSPPVAGTLWREQLPQDGDTPWIVDGHVIPRGTQVGVNIYSLHHNEEYFPDPFTYKPERWLGDQGKSANRAAFMPFSTGARGCAGKAMAYQETSLVMTKTLWYFDFEPASHNGNGCAEVNENGEFLLYEILTSYHDGPYLMFKTRGDLWKEIDQ
ncbi:benzoate 4-monooxygenase cytochrome P450 [Camillea tinctor]|nr:benzoate 4-monooxygenase cytochrome P450 [Camillea tinctor]